MINALVSLTLRLIGSMKSHIFLVYFIGVSFLAFSSRASSDINASTQDPETAQDPLRPNEDWHPPIYAYCAGGPLYPKYAYLTYNEAELCRAKEAEQSEACEEDARVGRCIISPQNRYVLEAIPPFQCACDPQLAPVGSWD